MAGPVRTFWRRHKRPLLVLAALLFVFDLALHLGFREPVHTYFYGLGGELWDEDPELFWVPVEGFDERWRQVADAAPGKLIFNFGGSIPTNHRANTNYPAELEKRLPGWTVANFATGGYTSHQSLVLLGRALQRRAPDVVLVSHAYNERGVGFAPDSEMAAHNRRASVRALHALSRLKVVAVWRRLMWKVIGYDPYAVNPQHPRIKQRVSPVEHEANVRALVDQTTAVGAKLVFVSQANLDPAVTADLEPYFAVQREAARTRGHVFFCDVQPAATAYYHQRLGRVPEYLKDDPALLLLHVDACHYSDAGHNLVADVLRDFLRDNVLGPKALGTVD